MMDTVAFLLQTGVVVLLLAAVSAFRQPHEEHALPGWKGEAELPGNQVVYGQVRPDLVVVSVNCCQAVCCSRS